MNQLVTGITHNGLKCDHCDWKDETIAPHLWDEWINRPCPTCGNNLLTLYDYEDGIRVLKACAALAAMNDEEIRLHFGMSEAEFNEAINHKSVTAQFNVHKGDITTTIKSAADDSYPSNANSHEPSPL